MLCLVAGPGQCVFRRFRVHQRRVGDALPGALEETQCRARLPLGDARREGRTAH